MKRILVCIAWLRPVREMKEMDVTRAPLESPTSYVTTNVLEPTYQVRATRSNQPSPLEHTVLTQASHV